MAAHPSYAEDRAGHRWLMLAAEMAGLASGSWRQSPDAVSVGWGCLPRIATCALSADGGSVREARDFCIATLHRWGTAERGEDIAIVVSELLTNALRHARPQPGDTRPRRPIRLGVVQPGRCVLCAVADSSTAVPAPRTPGSLAETGRGLHIVGALSDRWGYTTPTGTGKVVWALFHSRPIVPAAASPTSRPDAYIRSRRVDVAPRLSLGLVCAMQERLSRLFRRMLLHRLTRRTARP